MNKTFTTIALIAALALPAAAAISPETFVSAKADRLDTPAQAKSDLLKIHGDLNDGSVIIGYQTGLSSITLFRVPLMTASAR
jgi:hypothetical protein